MALLGHCAKIALSSSVTSGLRPSLTAKYGKAGVVEHARRSFQNGPGHKLSKQGFGPAPKPRIQRRGYAYESVDNEVGSKRLADFDLKGRVFLVTGGASGIGLTMAEGLVEAGGKVYTLDRAPKPSDHWEEAKRRVKPEWGGELHYARVDVSKTQEMTQLINDIAESNQRLDGLMAAAAIQQVTPAIDYEPEDLMQMMAVNYNGVFMAAQATAKQMMRFQERARCSSIAEK